MATGWCELVDKYAPLNRTELERAEKDGFIKYYKLEFSGTKRVSYTNSVRSTELEHNVVVNGQYYGSAYVNREREYEDSMEVSDKGVIECPSLMVALNRLDDIKKTKNIRWSRICAVLPDGQNIPVYGNGSYTQCVQSLVAQTICKRYWGDDDSYKQLLREMWTCSGLCPNAKTYGDTNTEIAEFEDRRAFRPYAVKSAPVDDDYYLGKALYVNYICRGSSRDLKEAVRLGYPDAIVDSLWDDRWVYESKDIDEDALSQMKDAAMMGSEYAAFHYCMLLYLKGDYKGVLSFEGKAGLNLSRDYFSYHPYGSLLFMAEAKLKKNPKIPIMNLGHVVPFILQTERKLPSSYYYMVGKAIEESGVKNEYPRAKQCYEKAKKLGSKLARERLEEIEGNKLYQMTSSTEHGYVSKSSSAMRVAKIAVCAILVIAVAAVIFMNPFGSNESPDDPIVPTGPIAITGIDDLYSIKAGEEYYLDADIDLSGRSWSSKDFNGVIDGRGHTITGLTSPLFKTMSGTVQNIVFVDVVIDGDSVIGAVSSTNNGKISKCSVSGEIVGEDYVGGLCGDGNGTIFECSNSATITGNSYIGGIAGQYGGIITSSNNSGSITAIGYCAGGIAGSAFDVEDCKNDATVTVHGMSKGHNAGAGGIVGVMMEPESKKASIIKNLENSGDVIVDSEGTNVGGITGYWNMAVDGSGFINRGNITCIGGYAGGLFGLIKNESQQQSYTLTDARNYGAVSSKGDNVGGIAGYEYDSNLQTINITDCHNEGLVKSTSSYVGGLVGCATKSNIFDCSNKGNVEGRSYVAGIVGCSQWGVTRLTNTGSITATGHHVGGISGYLPFVTDCSNEGKIQSSGMTDAEESYAGGIAGSVGESNTKAKLSGGLSNSGKVISLSEGRYVGGLIGYFDPIVDSSSYTNVGDVASNGGYVGGLFGALSNSNMSNSPMITDASNSGKVTSEEDYVGGIAGGCITGGYHVNLKSCESKGNVSGNKFVAGIFGYSSHTNVSDSLIVCTIAGYSDVDAVINTTNGDITNCDTSGAVIVIK